MHKKISLFFVFLFGLFNLYSENTTYLNRQQKEILERFSELDSIDIEQKKALFMLNYLQFATNRVVNSNNIFALEEEYNILKDNMSLSEIKDEETINAMTGIMDLMFQDRQRLKTSEHMKVALQRKLNQAIYNKTSAMILGIAGSVVSSIRNKDLIGLALGTATTAVSMYMGYKEHKNELNEEFDEEMFELEIAKENDLNEWNKKLITYSHKIIQRYGLSDDWRYSTEQINEFLGILEDPSNERKYKNLKKLITKRFYPYFPMFWYHLAKAAVEARHENEALAYFEMFDKENVRIYRVDPIAVDAYMTEVKILSEQDLESNRDRILERLRFIEENSSEWSSLYFCACMYAALGDNDKALILLEENKDSLSYKVEKNGSMNSAADGLELSSALFNILKNIDNEKSMNERYYSDVYYIKNAAENEIRSISLTLSGNKISFTVPTVKMRNSTEASVDVYAIFENGNSLSYERMKRKAKSVNSIYSYEFTDKFKNSNLLAINFDNPLFPLYLTLTAQRDSFDKIYDKFEDFLKEGRKFENDGSVDGYILAAEKGDAKAQNSLGMYYLDKNDFDKAFKWFEKAAAQGHTSGMYNLGYCYHNGVGVSKNYDKAFEWFRKSAEQGDDVAQNRLGSYYFEGKYGNIGKNCKLALDWYEKSAEQGNADSQWSVGYIYYNECEGVNKDYNKAFEWFSKAAEQNLSYAQYWVGTCYAYGTGVKQDYEKAFEWFSKAAEQGHIHAQYELGSCYLYGNGVSKDSAKAVEWLTRVAEQGDVDAQFKLGVVYDRDEYGLKDSAKAVEWYEKAAAQNHAIAQNNLGWCYLYGNGVKQDYYKAVELFTKSAEQKNTTANFWLGHCYYNGLGVKVNYKKATEYYKKSDKTEITLMSDKFTLQRTYRTKKRFYVMNGYNDILIQMLSNPNPLEVKLMDDYGNVKYSNESTWIEKKIRLPEGWYVFEMYDDTWGWISAGSSTVDVFIQASRSDN